MKGLNLNLQYNDFLIVSGPVGAGKTTFMLSLLKETTLISGKFEIKGKVAYVASDPFIFSGTILDNILFGEKYDE